jgi:hypothetical protein
MNKLDRCDSLSDLAEHLATNHGLPDMCANIVPLLIQSGDGPHNVPELPMASPDDDCEQNRSARRLC